MLLEISGGECGFMLCIWLIVICGWIPYSSVIKLANIVNSNADQ